MAGAEESAPLTSSTSLNWIELGDLPPQLRERASKKLHRFRTVGSIAGGFLFGGLCGFGSNVIISGSGSFHWNLPLFFAVGIPLGVGDFFFTRWYFSFIARESGLTVRRVAIASESLHLELDSGKLVEWRLKNLRVSEQPSPEGWFVVSVPAGRLSLTFWAPPAIASSIKAAAPSRS